MTFNTWADREENLGEINNKPSHTIPDMALTMRELLDRYTRGQSVPTFEQEYDDDEDFSEYQKLDKFEKMDLAKQQAEHIRQIQQELSQSKPKPTTDETTSENTPSSQHGDKQGENSGDKAGDKPQSPQASPSQKG